MRLLTFFLLLLLFPFVTFAQAEGIGNSWITTFQQCNEKFTLVGPTSIKINTPQEYALKNNLWTVLPHGEFVVTTQDGDFIESRTVERDRFVYSFPEAGIYKISVKLDVATHQCSGEISTEIHAFKEEIVYIGAERSDLSDNSFSAAFREKSVLLQSYFLDNGAKIESNPMLWSNMGNADILVFNTSDLLAIFSDMEKLQRLKENSFAEKNIFIISTQNPNFLSKVLASSVAKLGMKNIFLISEDQFSTLVSNWSYGDNRKFSIGERLSYEKKWFIFSLGTALEYLVYSGISYQFFWLLLALAVVALILNIFKQVIGLDVFMIYYPIFLGIIFSQMGLYFTIGFLFIAVFSILIVRLILRKIQLLVNAKKAFLVSVYILMIFLALGIDNLLNVNFLQLPSEAMSAIIAMFAILFVAEKLTDNIKLFSKSGVIHLLQYAFVLTVVFLVLNFKELQYFLISYPDVIFLIVIINLVVGRYMGLQIAEYIRFSPILRNINEEE